MTDQIREQVSALLDGELPRDQIGLLVRRMERDAELRRAFGSYVLVGETLRAPGGTLASPSFAARVSAAIDAPDGARELTPERPAEAAPQMWRRPAWAAGLAAGFALLAVVAIRPLANREPQVLANLAPQAAPAVVRSPLAGAVSPTPAQSQRLASYLVAHSQFSNAIGRHNVWSGLLAADPGLTRVSYDTAEGP